MGHIAFLSCTAIKPTVRFAVIYQFLLDMMYIIMLGYPNKMFRFPSPCLLWWWVRGSAGKKTNTRRDPGSSEGLAAK